MSSLSQSNEDRVARINMKEEISTKLHYWRQHSRSKWDCLCNQGTSFFYRVAESRKCRNEIKMICNSSEEWILDGVGIKGEFVGFFNGLFSANPPPPRLLLLWIGGKLVFHPSLRVIYYCILFISLSLFSV